MPPVPGAGKACNDVSSSRIVITSTEPSASEIHEVTLVAAESVKGPGVGAVYIKFCKVQGQTGI